MALTTVDFQVTMKQILTGGVEVENVLAYQKTSAYAAGDEADLITAVGTEWIASVVPELGPQIELTEIRVENLGNGTIDAGIVTGGTGTHSPGGSQVMPGSIAACVSLRTATNTKSGRGRVYLCGITSDRGAGPTGGDPNRWTSTARSDFQSAIDGIKSVTTGGETWSLCVFSRKDLTLRPVITVLVDGFIDTQRRRLR